MTIDFHSLLIRDVQTVFNDIDVGRAVDTLQHLTKMADQIFGDFSFGNPRDAWIADMWATGKQYGYKGFLEQPPAFQLQDNAILKPLPIQLAQGDGQLLTDAFRYLFTNVNRSHRRHWNCSNRSGGHTVFPNNSFSAQLFNQLVSQISGIDDRAVHQQPVSVPITKTVIMHLVWPFVFPVWYKQTKDGYSQIDGMIRLLNDIAYYSGEKVVKRGNIDLRGNYLHYAAVYRILLSIYKKWVAQSGAGQEIEPHFDFFTQFLADLIPEAKPKTLLKTKKALVLYGVPGTGKTYRAKALAKELTEDERRIKVVQFHPGYSYADFVIGIRPKTNADGGVKYETVGGTLYQWAEAATNAPHQKFCLIIDEINRANLAEVLGEAMYCLEYRGKENSIQLPQVIEGARGLFEGGTGFYLPENLYVIGTMNHADRSVSGFDMALRRRFGWYRMEPMNWVKSYLTEKEFDRTSLDSFLDAAEELNDCISKGQAVPNSETMPIPLNADHQIGDSYFAAIKEVVFPPACPERSSGSNPRRILPQHRQTLWLYNLRPLLEDYLGNDIHSYRDALTRLGRQFVGE